MSNVAAITGVTSSSGNQQILAVLEAQMALYAQSANSSNLASADYKALQAAITSGNITAAQVALSRLQRDTHVSSATPAPPAPVTSATSSPADTAVQTTGSSSINTTA